MLKVGGELGELGGQVVETRFRTHVDVVEHAIHHVAAAIDFGGHHFGLRLAALCGGTAERNGFQEIFPAGGIEARIHAVQRQRGVVGDLELQRTGHAQAFLFMGQAAVARQARMEHAGTHRGVVRSDIRCRVRRARDAGAAVGRTGTGAAGRVGRGHAQRAAEAAGIDAGLPAHRAEAFLQQVALAVGRRQQGAHLAISEDIADQRRTARIPGLGQVVVAHLPGHRGGETVVVERAGAAQVDGSAERAFLHRSRLGLAHGEVAEKFGCEHVEVEAATTVGATRTVGTTGSRQCLHAVDAHAGEVGPQAAHGDRAAFAGIAIDRYAGDALQRFGQVQVRELADVLGHDRIDLVNAVALLVQRLGQALAEGTDHGHRLQVLRLLGSRLCLLLLRGHGRDMQGEGDRGRKYGNRCLFVRAQLAHLNPPPDDALNFMRALTWRPHFPRFVSGK